MLSTEWIIAYGGGGGGGGWAASFSDFTTQTQRSFDKINFQFIYSFSEHNEKKNQCPFSL